MKRPKLQTLPKLKRDLEKLFNEYIRLRDSGKPCISCGRTLPLQAGHFYSVKNYDGLRFHEDNVHGEWARCNCFDDRHLLNYASNLPQRIGEQACSDLEYLANLYKKDGYKWSRAELNEMIEEYKLKIKLIRD